jgi:uncharacterized protein
MRHSLTEPSATTIEKMGRLRETLEEMESVLLAYSGGVDSTLLLRVARDVLGERVLAVTARSPLRAAAELAAAQQLATSLGASHLLIDGGELDDPEIAANPLERCYLCKRRLFRRLKALAAERGLREVIDGSNRDDLGEHRPGLRALRQLGVRSPLAESELSKDEIRSLSRMLGLSTWDRPSQSCLATRFPYGEQLSPEKLTRAEDAEGFLQTLGFRELRVRSHGSLARIEVPPEDMPALLQQAATIVARLEELGFAHISMDLKGYRTGSMDEMQTFEDIHEEHTAEVA